MNAPKQRKTVSSLNFPNPSRTYLEQDHGVRFWGYDQTFEIEFFIGENALSMLDPQSTLDEVGFLHTFDLHCDRIHRAASDIYSQRRKPAKVFSYTLVASDVR